MTTREAFYKLITTPAVSKLLNKTRGDIARKKSDIDKLNKYPSEELMSEYLELAGWKVKQEKMWEEKK